jgi:hypothetical protein
VAIEHGIETVNAPALGREGEPCARCGSPLAADQRYCLECGTRRADARLPFQDVLEDRIRRENAPAPPGTALAGGRFPRPQVSPVYAGAGVAALALALLLGILIGSAGDDSPRQVAAAPPQVISVAAPASGQPVAEEFTSDWPEGQDGYTVQLRTLPKDGTQVSAVQAAKSEAQSQGASDVGALDSDDFGSLDPGNYVIYAGIFDTRKQAKKQLSRLRGDFSGARIVHVAAGGSISGKGDKDALSGKKKEATVGKDQLKDLQKLSPEEYQKKAKKLPDTTKLPGKAPPKDDKKPGGGSEGDVIE